MLGGLLSTEKRFDHRWVGSPALNAVGLHVARMALARACEGARRAQVARGGGKAAQALRRDGYVVLRDYLPSDAFAALRDEVRARAATVAARSPRPTETDTTGFGLQLRAEWGFDRFDGGTLNRFIDLGTETPRAAALAHDPALTELSRALLGRAYPAGKLWIYETVQGAESANPDPQKQLHRDTFYDGLKLWFFLDPVRESDGPLVYVPGSHRLTRRRREWEARRARTAARTRSEADDVDGSFRITEAELAALGLPAPRALPVPANTLIVANVFGFHRRGDAAAGAKRLALYGTNRSHPFRVRGT